MTEKGRLSLDIEFLRDFNAWRRGSDEIPIPHPAELGKVIDRVCEHLELCLAKPAKK